MTFLRWLEVLAIILTAGAILYYALVAHGLAHGVPAWQRGFKEWSDRFLPAWVTSRGL